MQPKLYHMGIRSRVSRNTLAHANGVRDWRIHADFAQVLIGRARRLYADEDLGEQLRQATLYALDSTPIDLCLSLFPWAHFRRAKAAVKTQTRIAITTCLRVALLKKELGLEHDLDTILQVLSVSLFEKTPL